MVVEPGRRYSSWVQRTSFHLHALRAPNTRNWRRWLRALLIGLGAVLVLYVASQYGMMYAEQRRLERAWTEQNSASPASSVRPRETAAVHEVLPASLFPKSTSMRSLWKPPATSSCCSGPAICRRRHRPARSATPSLPRIGTPSFDTSTNSKGDSIQVRRNGNVYTYRVTGKQVVKPEDLSVLSPSPDRRLTLITCYPTYYIGPAPDRLVVFSKMVEDAATPATGSVPQAPVTSSQ